MSRLRRAKKTRKKLQKLGVSRLVVHRTLRHIYAQVIVKDNLNNFFVLASASTLEKSIIIKLKEKNTSNKYAASLIGQIIAERAIDKGITNLSFDRSGFKYHGRVQALAESARRVGLQF